MSGEDDEKKEAPVVPEPSPWISREGDVVHPDAPAGSGGLGRFRTQGSLGSEGNDPFGARHPRSPSLRTEALSDDEKAEVLGEGVKIIEKPRNPPPATVPGTQPLKKAQPTYDLDMTIEILADGKDDSLSGAKTDLKDKGVSIDGPQFRFNGPDDQKEPNPTDKLTAIIGKPTVTGSLTIQVVYGTVGNIRVEPREEAAWGRGTTSADAAAKNITVGFHESCHRDDFIAYLKANAPVVTASFRAGMTYAEYLAEQDRILKAIDAWTLAAQAATRAKTDETGYTMTAYKKDHPGATGH
jgi:hypothetical protein